MKLKAPFPAFGGKSKVASMVWQYLGDVDNYIEPFANSAAVLLARPHAPRVETINDWDQPSTTLTAPNLPTLSLVAVA